MDGMNHAALKKDIEYLSILAECPDIEIKSFRYEFGGFRLRAELTLPSGQIIASEQIVAEYAMNDEEFIEVIKRNLLKDIGALFITNAYRKRVAGEVKLRVGDYYYMHKEIIDEVNKCK